MIFKGCQIIFQKPLFGFGYLCLLSTLLCGVIQAKTLDVNHDEILPQKVFPQNGIIQKQKLFWKKIFGHYKSYQHVIHDRYDPEIILGVIDFSLPKFKRFKKKYRSYKSRDGLLQEYLDLYQDAVSKIRKTPHSLELYKINPFAKKILEVYSNDSKKWDELVQNGVSLRSQAGLRDGFEVAVKRADKYLPMMEKVFASYKLPIALTRLPFVESMFSNRVRSKVGASGIWQFMPKTARSFVRVNRYVDERNSPIKATRAAARLFRSNYKILKTWPLAVTAYNHGITGLKRAMRKHGVYGLDEIIVKHHSNRFGFASKNFYAEFLAATEVYQELQSSHPDKKNKAVDVEKYRIKRRYSLNQLTRYTPLSNRMLREHNPCLTSKGLRRYRYKPLPKNYEIFVPKRIAKKFKKMVRKIKL